MGLSQRGEMHLRNMRSVFCFFSVCCRIFMTYSISPFTLSGRTVVDAQWKGEATVIPAELRDNRASSARPSSRRWHCAGRYGAICRTCAHLQFANQIATYNSEVGDGRPELGTYLALCRDGNSHYTATASYLNSLTYAAPLRKSPRRGTETYPHHPLTCAIPSGWRVVHTSVHRLTAACPQELRAIHR